MCNSQVEKLYTRLGIVTFKYGQQEKLCTQESKRLQSLQNELVRISKLIDDAHLSASLTDKAEKERDIQEDARTQPTKTD